MAGRKPKVAKELQIECYKKYKDALFINDEVVPLNTPVYKTIAKELDMRKESVYLAVSRYAKEIYENAIINRIDYKSDSEDDEIYSPFNFELPSVIRSKSEYVINLNDTDVFNINSGKPTGEWSSKLNKELWKVIKMSCCWCFKYVKFISTLNEMKFEACCTECGAILHGYSGKDMKVLNVTIYNMVLNSKHGKKRQIRGEERTELQEKLQNNSAYCIRSGIADIHMDLGDVEPSLVPNLTTLRKIKASHKFENVDPIITLRLLKSDQFYSQCIADIGLDPFFVFYSSPAQKEYYRLKTLKGPSRISIDATGLNLRSSVLSSYSVKKDTPKYIFLYSIMLKSEDNHSVAVHQMLSQRQSSQFIHNFLEEWKNTVKTTPVEVVTDESAALMTACIKSFTQCHSINEYCNMCMNVLLDRSTVLPHCYIRLDRFHFIRKLHRNELIKKQVDKKRRIFFGVFGFLLQCADLKLAEEIIKHLLVLILNEYNDMKTIEGSRRRIIEISATIEMEEFDEEQNELVFLEAEENEDVSSTENKDSIALEWINIIIQQVDIIRNESDMIENFYYAPELKSVFIKILSKIVLFSNLMMPKFNSPIKYATSAFVESEFKNIKKYVTKNEKMRIDKFVTKHLSVINGNVKIEVGKIKKEETEGDSEIIESENESTENKMLEENWKLKNTDVLDRKRRNRRSKKTILNPLTDNDRISDVLVLHNGYMNKSKTKSQSTFNTCAFDSIMYSFLVLDVDYKIFDENEGGKFINLLYAIRNCEKIIKKAVYVERNNLLYEIYDSSENLPKSYSFEDNINIKQLNCYSGVTELFVNICLNNQILNSMAIINECKHCQTIATRLNPFVLVDLQKTEMENIHILTTKKEKQCKCGRSIQIKYEYNDIVCIEVGKLDVSRQVAFNSIQTKIVLNEENYSLKAVIEHTGCHFKTYVLRKNEYWECFDDLLESKSQNVPAKLTVACLFFVKGSYLIFSFIILTCILNWFLFFQINVKQIHLQQ